MHLVQKKIETITPLVEKIRKLHAVGGYWASGGAARRAAQGLDLDDEADIDMFVQKLDIGEILMNVPRALGPITRIHDQLNLKDLDPIWFNRSRGSWAAPWAAQQLFPDSHAFANPLPQTRTPGEMMMAAVEKTTAEKHLLSLSIGSLKMHFVDAATLKSAADILQTFDFTVCQFITNGHVVLYPQASMDDLENRVLRVFGECVPKTKTLSRVARYTKYGFIPSPSVLAWAVSKSAVSDQFDVLYA